MENAQTLICNDEWVLQYRYGDDCFIWVADVPLWEAITMLVGIFHILGLSPADAPGFVKANYEARVSVWRNEDAYYEGMLGNLASIALQELADKQESTPTRGRGTG